MFGGKSFRNERLFFLRLRLFLFLPRLEKICRRCGVRCGHHAKLSNSLSRRFSFHLSLRLVVEATTTPRRLFTSAQMCQKRNVSPRIFEYFSSFFFCSFSNPSTIILFSFLFSSIQIRNERTNKRTNV